MSKFNCKTGRPFSNITRRRFLYFLAGLGGVGAVHHGMTTLGLMPTSNAHAFIPSYPPHIGKGNKVIVIGAGLAGLCAAYNLVKSGFTVKVIEANPRCGGRSLTVRQGDSFQEVGQPLQTCQFSNSSLYFNAGPGRIPNHHRRVLNYCREFNVKLEPFIFICNSNRLQSDDLHEGAPILFRQLQNNLRGHVAELLSKVPASQLDVELTPEDHDKFLAMLAEFGSLNEVRGRLEYGTPDAKCSSGRRGEERAGYKLENIVDPDELKFLCAVGLDPIINSQLWNKELFNQLRYTWQASLLQPVGGMDMIWKAFLNQSLPRGGNLMSTVTLNSPVHAVRNVGENQVEVTHGPKGREVTESAAFCISTMTPRQLKTVGQDFSANFNDALGKFPYVPSCKVGWQAKTRFWEMGDHPIFGGISWTKHRISQIWYPSNGFHSTTGILTAAYNRGEAAEKFGKLSLEQRFEEAYAGGEKLHPGNYRQHIDANTALGIAWQNMPYFEGGWQDHAAEENEADYRQLLNAIPEGQVYLAGDFLGYLPGWMEGSLAAAEWAVERIIERV